MKHYHIKSLHRLLEHIKPIALQHKECKNPWECDHIYHDYITLKDLVERPQDVSDTLTYIRKEGL